MADLGIEMPLLAHIKVDDVDYDKEDDSDYVMVFYNPYNQLPDEKPEGKSLDRVTKKKAIKSFLAIFRTGIEAEDSDEPYITDLRNDIHEFVENWEIEIGEKQEELIPFDIFSEFWLQKIVWLLNEHLMLKVDLFNSADNSKLFCKLRATTENLKIHADLIDYPLQFKSCPEDKKPFMTIPPYAPFKRNETTGRGVGADSENLYKQYNKLDQEVEEGCVFRDLDRIRLVHHMIYSYLSSAELYYRQILETEYPLHRERNLGPLSKNMLGWRNWLRGLDKMQIRNYYGSKIALYFSWLSAYTWWLILPGLIGVVCWILKYALHGRAIEDRFETKDVVTFLYWIMITLFSTWFDQSWKRDQNNFALLWGQTQLEKTEVQRPEFKGKRQLDDVTGKIKKISVRSRLQNYLAFLGSRSIAAFMIVLVIGTVASLFLLKSNLSQDVWGRMGVGFVNAVQIQIFNRIYSKVARRLTDWENLETETQWFDAMTFKLFIFQFVNSYNSLVYIAFFKQYSEGCVYDLCLRELDYQLMIIFITNFLLNIVELGFPWLKKWMKYKKAMKTYKRIQEKHPEKFMGRIFQKNTYKMTPTEEQINLNEYESPLEDYMEMIIQYGYIVMFSASFPLAPIIAYVINIIEIRVDGFKLLKLTRRPQPQGAKSIGMWLQILRFLSFCGIFTNASIIVFTSDMVKIENSTDDFGSTRWLTWLIIINVLYVLKELIAALYPQYPGNYQDAVMWQKRVVDEKLYSIVSDMDKRRANLGMNMKFEGTKTVVERDKIPNVNHPC